MSVTKVINEAIARIRYGQRKHFTRVPVEIAAAVHGLKVWCDEYAVDGQPTEDELQQVWKIIREHV